MISFSEMGYLIILAMKPVHIIFQTKSMIINVSAGKEKTLNRKKKMNNNVK